MILIKVIVSRRAITVLVFFYTMSLRGDEGGVHTAFGMLVVDSCEILCPVLFGRISSGQLICFGFDGVS